MLTSKNNQFGNTLIAVLLACIFLAAITEIVIIIYNRHQVTDSIITSSSQSSKPKEPSTVSPVEVNKIGAGSSSSTSTSTSVVTIPSLGIQITVPTSLKGLTYSISTNSKGAKIASFSTPTISTEIPSCAAGSGTGAFDTIEVVNGKFSSSTESSSVLIKQYSSYYIAYQYPKGPCASNLTPSEQTLLDSSSQDFTNSLPSVQAAT